MEYITVREAAEKWMISERLAQKYCAQGRIEGARKFGVSWGIPADAEKPGDPRRERKAPSVRDTRRRPACGKGLMPLLNMSFEPGRCMDSILKIEEGPQRAIACSEYHYFSGQPEKAAEEAELYLTHPEEDIRLSACLIYAYANLSIGQIQLARHALMEVKAMSFADGDTAPETRAASAFIASAASVLLHLPLPEGMAPEEEILPLLPPGVRSFALYVRAHFLYLQKEYEKSVGVAEAALAMGARDYPIPAIYLHLAAVMDYMSLRQPEQAQRHLLAAWELARPDDLIEGFGEHHGLLGGMLEAVIKPSWPEDFKRIIAITYRFSAGWRKVHNPDTGHDVADNLTTTEFAAAMLAARGWTNQEIGQHMNISPHTVKRYISTALQKLDISHRQELKKYMLK